MTKDNETKTTVENPNFLIAYAVREYQKGKDKRSIFTRVGAAFPHKDGIGFNLQLDCIPLDGKLVILPPKERDEDNGQQV